MTTDTTTKQLYKLISSYHRTSRLEFKWAVQKQEDAEKIIQTLEQEAKQRERRIISAFTIASAVLCLTTFFCVRQEMLYVRREITRNEKAVEEIINGNPVFAVGDNRYYGVIETTKGNSDCHTFIAGPVDGRSPNGRAAFINAEGQIRFTIPEGCKP